MRKFCEMDESKVWIVPRFVKSYTELAFEGVAVQYLINVSNSETIPSQGVNDFLNNFCFVFGNLELETQCFLFSFVGTWPPAHKLKTATRPVTPKKLILAISRVFKQSDLLWWFHLWAFKPLHFLLFLAVGLSILRDVLQRLLHSCESCGLVLKVNKTSSLNLPEKME